MKNKTDKIILGIATGTRILGIGVIRVLDRTVEYLHMGVVNLKGTKDHFVTLRTIYEEVTKIIEKYNPDELAVEAPFYGKNVQVMLKLGRAQGAAIAAALQRDIPIFEYAPRSVKLAVTGKGAASKEQVSMMIQKTLKIDLDPKYLDATDALAIALCHHYQQSNPLAGVGGKSDWKKFLEDNPDRVKK